jgi:hypothetical protein
MTPDTFIQKVPVERHDLMSSLHSTILNNDKTVNATVESMMGKEMIMYKCTGFMKYALASAKNYMTLHVLPIYGSKMLYEKYLNLLPKATFQKGCINFKTADEIPLKIVGHLITDCEKINLLKIKQEYIESKKIAKKRAKKS